MMIPAVSTVILGLLFFLSWAFLRAEGSWMKTVILSSLSVKGALLILLWSCLSGDPYVTVAALAALILGDLSVMILAIVLERWNT